MSSFVAHAVAAYAIKTGAEGPSRRLTAWALLPVLAFAWLPDGDYALRMLGFGSPDVRWSHSFVFVLSVWLVYLGAAHLHPWLRHRFGGRVMAATTLAAGLSHLVMDWLVASSWGDPLFWPLSTAQHSSPLGIFPWGSSNMDPSRLRTWQNLAMELGVLLPLAAVAVWHRQGRLTRARLLIAGVVAMPFAAWAASLPR